MRDGLAATTIEYRPLDPAEIERTDEIDRTETIDYIYRLRRGKLALEAHHRQVRGWQPGSLEASKQVMRECMSRGGAAWGAFVEERLVGIAVLDGKRIESDHDALDLYFLHVSSNYRGRGIGRSLVGLVAHRARELGARRLYVSATPSQNTINFYQGAGFELASLVDPELFRLEPEDIHMDLQL